MNSAGATIGLMFRKIRFGHLNRVIIRAATDVFMMAPNSPLPWAFKYQPGYLNIPAFFYPHFLTAVEYLEKLNCQDDCLKYLIENQANQVAVGVLFLPFS